VKKIRHKGEKSAEKKTPKNELITVDCPVCKGVGRLEVKRKLTSNADVPGSISKRQRPLPEGWVVPGPKSAGGVEPERGEELCSLLGHWRIFQRIGGHRWSTDDLVTAWLAGKAWREANPSSSSKGPEHCLDLGCGIGTVLQMNAWAFENAKVLGVEAQELSASMARRSIQYNGCQDRCEVILSDIRSFDGKWDKSPDGKFDLITGTPPYFPVTFSEKGDAATPFGGLPTCEQSAPARYEFRGGVEAYCAAAKPRLRDENSRFVVCEGYLETNHDRVMSSAADNGLHVLRQVCVHGRDDKPALFAVYEMSLASTTGTPLPEMTIEKLIVRYKGGKRSDEYVQLMATMGIPP